MNRQLHRRFHPDPRSKLALFVAACLCVFSGMTRMQEIVLLLLCIIVLLLCKKAGRAVAVVLLFLLMTLGDQLLVSRLSGVAQYAVLLICHVLRFLLPLAVSFYLVTKTVTVGAYISAFTAMRLPGEVVIPHGRNVSFRSHHDGRIASGFSGFAPPWAGGHGNQ